MTGVKVNNLDKAIKVAITHHLLFADFETVV